MGLCAIQPRGLFAAHDGAGQGRAQEGKVQGEANVPAVHANGWSVLVVWECEAVDTRALADRLVGFLGPVNYLARSRV